MLRANYTTISIIIGIIIETFIFINLVEITCIAAAQNQTTPLIIANNNHLISNNNSASDDDHNELISYVTKLFCQLNSNPVYIYIDHEMQFSRIVEDMTISIHGCMRSTILVKRIDYSSPYDHQQLSTNNILNFTLFLIINQLSDRPDQQFSFISKFTKYKNMKKFILFISNTGNNHNLFKQLFQEFHHKHIYNILVVARNQSTNYNVMTYNPFTMSNYVEYFNRNESRPEKLFYNKMFGNVHKRIRIPIRIILFEERSRMIVNHAKKILSGIDGLMLQVIMKSMNANFEIIRARDNQTYGAISNRSTYGTLKDIQEWYGDVSFNSRFMKPNEYLNIVEPSVVLGRDDLCLIVPNSGNQSNIGNLLHSFSEIIWFLIVLMIFFVSTVMYCTQKLTRRWKRPEIRYVVLTVFRLNLNQALRKMPKMFQMRIVLIAWLLYCILITNSFIANLTSVLILERERQQIESLADLAQSGLKILAAFRYKNDIMRNLNMTNPSHVKIANRIRVVEDPEIHALIENNTINYAYVEKDHFIKYILDQRSHLFNGRRLFHEMQQCPVPGVITYITPIGTPYLDQINFLIRQILETGLYGFWNKNLENERKSKRIRRFIKNNHDSGPFKNLTLSHLQLVFYMLSFGLSVATIVFLVEMRIAGKYWTKSKFKQTHSEIIQSLSKFVKNVFGRNKNIC